MMTVIKPYKGDPEAVFMCNICSKSSISAQIAVSLFTKI